MQICNNALVCSLQIFAFALVVGKNVEGKINLARGSPIKWRSLWYKFCVGRGLNSLFTQVPV